jgi:hypothetical protein
MTSTVREAERFMAALPEVARGGRAVAGAGTLALFVQDAGAWTVDFGGARTGRLEVRAGASLDADCVLVLGREDFDRLLGGEAPRRPVVQGDPALVSALGRVLTAPVRGALGARLSGARDLPPKPKRRRRIV